MIITCTKLFPEFPFAHRQPKHDGHCAWIHGHNWSFEFTFAADLLDDKGFVIDFGKLLWLKIWLENRFDHTLVLNEDDPVLGKLQYALAADTAGDPDHPDLAKIVTVPNCGAEGIAAYLLKEVNALLPQCRRAWDDWDLRIVPRSVQVVQVRVWENSKNFATATQEFNATNP